MTDVTRKHVTDQSFERELERLKERERFLLKIVSGETYDLGDSFFKRIVEHLAERLELDVVFIGRSLPGDMVETLAFYKEGEHILESLKFDLSQTPCHGVVGGELRTFDRDAWTHFPNDALALELRAEGYLGVPLFDHEKVPIGILTGLSYRPIKDIQITASAFLIFASRVAAEIEHQVYQELLKDEKKKAEEAAALMSSFLANMNHEVRTPLNIITGLSDYLLCEECGPEEKQKYLSEIQSASDDLANLVTDILTLSQIESGTYRPFINRFSVRELINQIQLKAEHLIKESGKSLELMVVGAKDKGVDIIEGDDSVITRILISLIGNAVKFTSEGKILIGFEKFDSEALDIYVEDTGIGIPSSEVDSIFEIFRQADGSPTRSYGGAGIGLALSKRMAEVIGAEISVKTTPDMKCGSRFTLRLRA